ncbi:hypothetical protein F4819DRAFT_448001 [Hypoxylon fuscum]|nr:hypothetical protein F4819DRAFT_448001 [Hypoxylon fuscum]
MTINPPFSCRYSLQRQSLWAVRYMYLGILGIFGTEPLATAAFTESLRCNPSIGKLSLFNGSSLYNFASSFFLPSLLHNTCILGCKLVLISLTCSAYIRLLGNLTGNDWVPAS